MWKNKIMKLFITIGTFNDRHQKWLRIKTWTIFGDSEDTKKLIVSIFQPNTISDQLYLPAFISSKEYNLSKLVLLFYSGKYL